jgi:hypothetical protein
MNVLSSASQAAHPGGSEVIRPAAAASEEEQAARILRAWPQLRSYRWQRIETAFRFLKAVCQEAGLTERQRRAALMYWRGRTNEEIGARLGVSPQCAADACVAAWRKLRQRFPEPEAVFIPAGDLRRCIRNRPDPEPDPLQFSEGQGETVALHATPMGMGPGDLAGPSSPAGRASVYYHALAVRLRDGGSDERPLTRVEALPPVVKPAEVHGQIEARRQTRRERRAKLQRERSAVSVQA